jgi:tRNA-uridine 2-sulfurtransferase
MAHGRPKAVVAMSGGVDSSVAAALLVDAGYDVTGIMLKLWRGDEVNHSSGCCSVGAADDARRVADVLGIPFYVLNFADRFEDSVVADFKAAYTAGRTPNPCVRCNQWIKFDALLEKATALGADVLATGHYARVVQAGDGYRLLRGVDARKDQSYVLWMLTQDQLARSRFPVGGMEKSETRAIAGSLGLRTARKPDSQEICFVKNGDFDSYVGEHLPGARGPILDTSGAVLGQHRGIGRYTVGQRKGLGISLGVPAFVTAIDAEENALIVGSRRDLAVGGLVCDEASFTEHRPDDGDRVLIQHRAHGDVHPGRIRGAGVGRFEIGYDQTVAAVAPGQSAALYSADRPDELLGGGVIAATLPVGADV